MAEKSACILMSFLYGSHSTHLIILLIFLETISSSTVYYLGAVDKNYPKHSGCRTIGHMYISLMMHFVLLSLFLITLAVLFCFDCPKTLSWFLISVFITTQDFNLHNNKPFKGFITFSQKDFFRHHRIYA